MLTRVTCVVIISSYVFCGLASGLNMSENGESKAFEISSREEKEIGVNKFVSGEGKQEIIYMNSGNYDMQQRSITYVPFNSLILSEGTMFVHGLDGLRKNTKPFGRWLNSILKKMLSR